LETQHLEFLEQIASLGRELKQTHAESTSRFHQVEKLTELLKVSEEDRARRLSQLKELDAIARDRQKELERRHLEFTERIALLGRELEQTRAESTARLHQIEKLTEQIDRLTVALAGAERDQGNGREPAALVGAVQPN
jgi:cell division protein FtsB